MSALAAQQAALVHALFTPRHGDAIELIAGRAGVARPNGQNRLERGLLAYRSNGLALAERALSAAYPCVQRLLGDDNFPALARRHWQQHPPGRGDVAHWGGAFAQHLASIEGLVEDQPWLPGVAQVEWALHTAATAPDADLDTASFELLATEADHAGLRLAPGWACIASDWPIADIVFALQAGTEPPLAPRAQVALVWRDGLQPRVRAAHAGEAALLRALAEGRPLAAALPTDEGFALDAWLTEAVQTRLVTGALRTQPIPGGTP